MNALQELLCFISSTFSHGKRSEKGAHKLLCLRHVSFPPFSAFLPLSCSSLPSGCVKRCGAVWVSSQTLEPNLPKSDTHRSTCTLAQLLFLRKLTFMEEGRWGGGEEAEKGLRKVNES